VPFRRAALHAAATIGFRQRGMQFLLANDANFARSNGSTSLDTAAFNGHTDLVRMLLEKGENMEATRINDGLTPLHTAVYYGHSGVVRLLLEKGANIERSDGRPTALYVASCFAHVGVVRLLLEKAANIEVTKLKDRRTALHGAALYLQTEAVRLLLGTYMRRPSKRRRRYMIKKLK